MNTKLKALITLLSGVLHSVNVVLFGIDASRPFGGGDDEKRTLIYVALKTLHNAKTYEQVLDALGFYSEALDFVEDEHTDMIDKVHDLKTLVQELRADKVNAFKERVASKELAEYQQALRQTQNALADARKEIDWLKREKRNISDRFKEAVETSQKLNEIITSHEIGENILTSS